MNKSIKVILSRLIIIFGLLYQLYYIYEYKNEVSYVAFLILAVGAFLTIQSEENWLQVKFTNWVAMSNTSLFLLQIVLFLLISYSAYIIKS